SILARVWALIDEAESEVLLHLPAEAAGALAEPLAQARQRGCSVAEAVSAGRAADPAAVLLVLVDGRRAVAGCLEPLERCQAVVGSNAGLIAALRAYFLAAGSAEAVPSSPTSPAPL